VLVADDLPGLGVHLDLPHGRAIVGLDLPTQPVALVLEVGLDDGAGMQRGGGPLGLGLAHGRVGAVGVRVLRLGAALGVGVLADAARRNGGAAAHECGGSDDSCGDGDCSLSHADHATPDVLRDR
jgi:hypothetical protein